MLRHNMLRVTTRARYKYLLFNSVPIPGADTFAVPCTVDFLVVSWKPILYWLSGPKNQSFRNKSGKTQPIRTKFDIRGRVKGWQRWRNFGRDRPILGKMGAGTNPAECEFFCLANHTTFQQLCNGRFSPSLVTKRSSVSRRWIRKDIFENFHFRGHLPPKSEIENRSNEHLTQSRLQVT